MGEDQEFGKVTNVKKDAAADQLFAMQAEMEKLKAQLAAAQSKIRSIRIKFSASFQRRLLNKQKKISG